MLNKKKKHTIKTKISPHKSSLRKSDVKKKKKKKKLQFQSDGLQL